MRDRCQDTPPLRGHHQFPRVSPKSQVSRLYEEIDEHVQAFLNWPLDGVILMNSVRGTEFPPSGGTFGAVNGPSTRSTPST